MKMENSQLMIKEKLGFFGILKEALAIFCRNPNFIILTFLTSLPLLCSMLLCEIIFQQNLTETTRILVQEPPFCTLGQICYGWTLFYKFSNFTWTVHYGFRKLNEEVSLKFLLFGFLYLGVVHLLDLIHTIIIISSASAIYRGEKLMNLKEMLCRPVKEASFKGPLITSFYAILLASLTLLGLVSLATQFSTISIDILFSLLVGLPFMALLIRYLEWSAVWNMGVVLSILEEEHGSAALLVSAHRSRGSRQRGFFFMLVFSVWRIALRLSYLYACWHGEESEILVTTVNLSLVCLGNVIKWVVFMIYFYDCKKRFLEKKVDVGDGMAAEATE